MPRRTSLENRPQYISNPLHKQAVDAYKKSKGKAARRARAIDRKLVSDMHRLDVDLPLHRFPFEMDVVAIEARFHAAGEGYDPFDAEEGSPY